MSTFEEPPAKRKGTSYELCLFCQTESDQPLVDTSHDNFKTASYETFLSTLHKRADLGNINFVPASKRLIDISVNILIAKQASWHSKCYKFVTNRAHTERDENCYRKVCTTHSISNLISRKRGRPPCYEKQVASPGDGHFLTRSKSSPYLKHRCFFCQNKTNETLHACSSKDRGNMITNIVSNSGNEVWKVQLGDVVASGDLLAKDVLYHHSCYTKNWSKFIQHFEHKSKKAVKIKAEGNPKFVAAEVEFIYVLQQRIDAKEYITIDECEKLYLNIFPQHGISDFKLKSRKVLKQLIQDNIENVTITKSTGKMPSIVHSNDVGEVVIRAAPDKQRNMHGDFKLLLQCGNIVRTAIIQAQKNPWTFKGSLQGNIAAGLPQELLSMIRWIIQGTVATDTEERSDDILRSCALIGQHIQQEFKSNRQIQYKPKYSTSSFRSTTETPIGVGLSLHSHHRHRQMRDISLLHHSGIGISYQRVKEITSKMASKVYSNMLKFNGVYIPPTLFKNFPIRCSIDNIDAKVDTSDGRNTFHGTALAVYQHVPSDISECETVAEPLKLDDTALETLANVPDTVTDMIPCNILGNPKPNRSPHYETFELGQNQDKVFAATQHDLAWLLVRYSQCKKGVQSTQTVPVWSAYNSLMCAPQVLEKHLDQDHLLPIVNAPAHEWRTLVTVLEKLFQLNGIVSPSSSSRVLVTLDMDLYKRALKLEYLNDKYSGKWMLCPGGFHIVLCSLRCLGKTVEHSGIDEAWSRDLYSSITVNQILNGNHHNRAIQAHEITLEALFELWFTEFLKENQTVSEALSNSIERLSEACKREDGVSEAHHNLLTVMEELNIEEQLTKFDKSHSHLPMFKWARMYMREVTALMNFTRSQKQPDLFLYLASLENLCKYFFSYNRLDYAQNIIEYISRVYSTKTKDPDLWNRLLSGAFALTKNTVSFTGTGVDQGQEFLNKILKGDGGLKGLTNKSASLLKYCLCAPELARLGRETEEMVGMTATLCHRHHYLTTASLSRREKNVRKLVEVLKPSNPFADKSTRLYNIMTKQVIPEQIEKDILNMEERGQQSLQCFVQDRILGNTNLWDRMTKIKYLNWVDACKTIKLKSNHEQFELKATNSLFARMLMIAKSSRQIDLQQVVENYEFTAINTCLLNIDGSLIPCTNKSELIHVLEGLTDHGENEVLAPDYRDTYLIIDGMSVVHEIMSSVSLSNCKQLGEAFSRTIESRCKGYEGGRVIFDNYIKQSSIKDNIRYHQAGVRKSAAGFKVEDTTPIFDTKVFLASNETKDCLTIYLAEKVLQLNTPIVSVTRLNVVSNTAGHQPTTAVSTHEEADTVMMLHASEICASGKHVHFMTQDTDVLVLALRRFPSFTNKTTVIIGTGKHRRKVPLQPIYNKLGHTKAAALPGFHCLTGCDTCGHIKGKSKRTAFKIFCDASQDVTKALTELRTEEIPSSNIIAKCELFLCQLMSTKTCSASSAGALRWKKFKGGQAIEKIPPTAGAWRQHILRAHMQAFIWNQDLVLDPVIPDPSKFGWTTKRRWHFHSCTF